MWRSCSRSEGAERPTYPVTLPRIVRRQYALAARARPVVAAAAVALMAIGIASRAPLQMDARESHAHHDGGDGLAAARDAVPAGAPPRRSRPPTGRRLEPMAVMASVPA